MIVIFTIFTLHIIDAWSATVIFTQGLFSPHFYLISFMEEALKFCGGWPMKNEK